MKLKRLWETLKSKPQWIRHGLIAFSLLAGLLLSLTESVIQFESRAYQRIAASAPQLKLDHSLPESYLFSFPPWLVLMILATLFAGWVVFRKGRYPGFPLYIATVFLLLLVEILLAVSSHVWIPVQWSLLVILWVAAIAGAYDLLLRLFPRRSHSEQQQLQTISTQIKLQHYENAIVLLKRCEFSDAVADLAYELGQLLEAKQNWLLARYLYQWMVEHDPGINDFVSRMDEKIKPNADTDHTLNETTVSKHFFGSYELTGKKATGATSTVYEARDSQTQQRVALKLLQTDAADDVKEMNFLHEALTVSRLDHTNIVKIHDAGTLNGQAYIAMDYISGYPLSERIRRKKLFSVAETLRVLNAMLEALKLAHQERIVHGDIKPANIMYDRVKQQFILTDFGAANQGIDEVVQGKKIIGTPSYMSPEQLSGKKTDGRSDLFSLAVTVYHLLTGIQPFTADNLQQIKNNVINKTVDLDSLTVPDSLRQVLAKALQKKPYQRFADAQQMLDAINLCEQQLRMRSH